jgi:hypothetical protein
MAVTTLTISMVPNAISNTLTISIPSALQSREAAGGSSAAYEAVHAIFKAGVFVDGTGRWWSAFQILSIVAS